MFTSLAKLRGNEEGYCIKLPTIPAAAPSKLQQENGHALTHNQLHVFDEYQHLQGKAEHFNRQNPFSPVAAREVHHLHVHHSVGKLFKEAMISETVNKIG